MPGLLFGLCVPWGISSLIVGAYDIWAGEVLSCDFVRLLGRFLHIGSDGVGDCHYNAGNHRDQDYEG